jgi:hypothetical protein
MHLGHTSEVTTVAISPDGKYIVSGSMDWYILRFFRCWGCKGIPGLYALPYLGWYFGPFDMKFTFLIMYFIIFNAIFYHSIQIKELFFKSLDSSYVDSDTERYDVSWISKDSDNKPTAGTSFASLIQVYIIFLYFADFAVPSLYMKYDQILNDYLTSRGLRISSTFVVIGPIIFTIFYLLFYVFHFAWIIMGVARIAGLAAILYLFIYSFGGILLYKNPEWTFLGTFEKVYEFIHEHSSDGLFSLCNPPTFLNKILNFPNYIFNILWRGGIGTIFIIFLLNSAGMYISAGRKKTIDMQVAIIFAVISLIFASPFIYNNWNKYKFMTSVIDYINNHDLVTETAREKVKVADT